LDYIEVLSPIVLRGLRPISAKYNSVREHHSGSKDGASQLHPLNMVINYGLSMVIDYSFDNSATAQKREVQNTIQPAVRLLVPIL
jgi:hypothetical protein